MSRTPWGYETEGEVPAMVTVEEFREMFPNMSSSDEQIEDALDSVSAAIRDYCGWHVTPNLACKFVGDGEGRILILPAMGVSSVESLSIDGADVPFQWRDSGIVRLESGVFPDKWRSVECHYHAGFCSSAVSQAVAQIAANSIVASPGVSDERAGNVQITYNRTGDGITGGVSLLARDRQILAPYKLARAW